MHKFFKLVLPCDDHNLGKLMYSFPWKLRYCFSRSRGHWVAGMFTGAGSHRSWNAGNCITDRKSIVSTCKTMLFNVKTLDLFFFGYTKTNGMLDHLENNRHCNSNPEDRDAHTCNLNTKSVEAAAYQKTFPVCTGSI